MHKVNAFVIIGFFSVYDENLPRLRGKKKPLV